MFVRQADTVFAERLSQVGEAGQQRLEARQRQAQSAFERQQDKLAASFAERISAADSSFGAPSERSLPRPRPNARRLPSGSPSSRAESTKRHASVGSD